MSLQTTARVARQATKRPAVPRTRAFLSVASPDAEFRPIYMFVNPKFKCVLFQISLNNDWSYTCRRGSYFVWREENLSVYCFRHAKVVTYARSIDLSLVFRRGMSLEPLDTVRAAQVSCAIFIGRRMLTTRSSRAFSASNPSATAQTLPCMLTLRRCLAVPDALSSTPPPSKNQSRRTLSSAKRRATPSSGWCYRQVASSCLIIHETTAASRRKIAKPPPGIELYAVSVLY